MLNCNFEPMNIEAFFAWQEDQSERYELVGGVPVRMIAGARNVHGDIVVNLVASLLVTLRGSGCQPLTGDGSIETLPGQIRCPDASVDCGAGDQNLMKATQPKLVAEALSPSTRDFDAFERLGECRTVESLDHILLIESNAAEIMHWAREPDRSWRKQRVAELQNELDLASLGITLALSNLYDGVGFSVGPRLVQDEPSVGPAG